jgi:hypothetical protein
MLLNAYTSINDVEKYCDTLSLNSPEINEYGINIMNISDKSSIIKIENVSVRFSKSWAFISFNDEHAIQMLNELENMINKKFILPNDIRLLTSRGTLRVSAKTFRKRKVM